MTDKVIKLNRGSEWRKWDLHLHSFYTSINNNFSSSTEAKYLQKIKDENIEVVGLTNYFNFSADDWGLKQKLEAKGIVVFLNLELRLTYTNKEDDCCDIHLIFSNDLNKSDIDTFLTKLNCSITGTQKTLSTITTKEEKEIAVVEFSKILEVLNDPAVANLKEKVLIGMLSRGKGNSRSSTMYASLTKDSNFIVHSSGKVENIEDDIKYWSGNDTEKPLKFKALFQNSDAHSIDKIGEKFSWVKGNPCFETLRQSVVDYENRILIQERNPMESKKASLELFIDKIEYKQCGKTSTIAFNKDINLIIGKRGAGKSVLIKHIAFNVLGESSEIKKIYKLEDCKIYWCDNNSENKFVEYIPQNYLSSITYEDGAKYDKRDQELRTRLFNNDLFKNADNTKTEAINSIELKIYEKIKEAISLHKQVIETANQSKPLGKAEDKEKSIKTKQEEINKLGKVNIEDLDIENQKKYVSEIELLEKETKLLEQDVQIIENITGESDVSFITVDDDAFLGLSQATLGLIKKQIKTLSSKEIKLYLDTLLKELKNNIKENKKLKITAEKNLKPINDKLQQNKTIEKILKEINKLNSDKKEIENLDKFIKESNEKGEKLIHEIVDLYLSFKSKIDGIVKTLKDKFNSFTFITFDFTVSYDVDLYKREFFDIYIDARSGERFKKFIEERRDFNKNETFEIIRDIVSNSDTAKLKTTGGDKENALVTLLSCRYDIDFTKSVKYKDGETLVDFENMTGGQKAMALLDLIFNLSKGGYPIIIDQPENDVDVSGISNELKKLILKQKEKRQVIIATHSPNLLLLTDSENVIVAENKNNCIEYHNNGIEDSQIQENIVTILEGGESALKKRMEKLNIYNML
ncbi:MAG: AAA family ATPase [Candidatus Paceibacterota bacterium]|jgi:hypothetical protein